MNADVLNPLTLIKEAISRLGFGKEETPRRPEKNKLQKAGNKPGNIPVNTNVRIIYEEDDTLKQVDATICYVTDTYVILNGGTTIALNRITKIAETKPLQLSNMLFI